MVAVFLIVGSIANTALFGIDLPGSMNICNAVGLALTAVVVRTGHSTIRATATVLYGIYLAAYLWTFVPRSY